MMSCKSAPLILTVCAMLAACANDGGATLSSSQIAAAIAAPIRTDDDRSNDADRKPVEFLQFLALRSGDKVAEINAGPGYNVRLLTTAVGIDGQVYASNAEFILEMFDGLNDRLKASVVEAANVYVSVQGDDRLDLPEVVDLAVLNNNYHDLHWQEIDTAVFNQSVFNALRPGGYFVVGDHQAPAGSGTEYAATLHRIDRELVISELEAAGFVLVSASQSLSNPEDDRSKPVFHPDVRGKTDRFLLKFQRPE